MQDSFQVNLPLLEKSNKHRINQHYWTVKKNEWSEPKMVDLVSEFLMADLWARSFQKVKNLQESRKASQRWNADRWRKIRETKNLRNLRSVQFSSVAQSCLTLCDPMDCSMPDFPVHHQLLEFTQTHVHCIGDAIQPSHPLLSPSPPTFNLSQHQGLFQWVNSSHEAAKVLEFQL